MAKKTDKRPSWRAKIKAKLSRPVKMTTTLLVATITLIVGATATFGVMYPTYRAAQTSNQAMSKIQTVFNSIYQNYYQQKSATTLVNGAIDGMLNSLNDQFSQYLSKSEAQDLSDTVSGSFTGIGAEVKKAGSQIAIVSAIANTPAAKAGLKANDIIEKINGKSMTNVSLAKAVSLIRGKKGTKVTLVIKRDNQTFTKTLVRASIPVTTVNAKMLKNHVGYVQVTQFSTNTAKEFKAALKKLQKQHASRFIIDVRNNPGGLMDVALQMASIFVKNGKTLLQTQTRRLSPDEYTASSSLDGGFKVTSPTVVLMNSGSASAAEIFAAALNQSANVKLVGTKSYGKGTVQTTQSYSDGTELKLTIAKWLTPNGTWINHKGLTPNVYVDYPRYAYTTMISAKQLKAGQVSSDVKKLQQFLVALGFKPGSVNGYYSAQTKAAVAAFQKQQKLSQTGVADKTTIAKLEGKVAAKIASNDPMLNKAVQVVLSEK